MIVRGTIHFVMIPGNRKKGIPWWAQNFWAIMGGELARVEPFCCGAQIGRCVGLIETLCAVIEQPRCNGQCDAQ